MYKLQKTPDSKAVLYNKVPVIPLATLKDEHGGVSHIIEDSHCYVLINKRDDGSCSMAHYWFAEAVEAVKGLPGPGNKDTTPCQYFSCEKIKTGENHLGETHYQSVPWCNHQPSQYKML